MAKEMRFDTHSLNSKAYIANDHTNDSFFFMLKVWVIFVSFKSTQALFPVINCDSVHLNVSLW